MLYQALLFLLVGAAIGVLVEERREKARARDRARARLSFDREATAALQHGFMDYIAAEGIPIDEDLPQVFANWLANETGATVVARQVDGDGIVIAMPDEED